MISFSSKMICSSFDCNKIVSSLKCPICAKHKLNKYFCSQICFKENWSSHKLLHKDLEKWRNNFIDYEFSGKLRPGITSYQRKVEKDTLVYPDYALHPKGLPSKEIERKYDSIYINNENDIKSIRKVCKLARETLDIAGKSVKVGITTDELDRIVHEAALERESYPSPLNYYGFPKSCCTSINEVICHGIPDSTELKDGDIVNIDVTLYYEGYHGDVNHTYLVGNVDENKKNLIKITKECLWKSIEQVKPGFLYKNIGKIIEKYVKKYKYSVVRSYCGHGVGRDFHSNPSIPHYEKNKTVGVMKPGHIFTIEPMINLGTHYDTLWPDRWTVTTVDGKCSAQFEETILVTETGHEVLTKSQD